MRKFRFKFAVILKQRQLKEQDALTSLAKAQRAYQAELQRKAELRTQLTSALERREALGIVPVDITAFKVEDDFIVGTKQRLIQQEQAIFRASKNVEKALRAFLFARRQTRMIESLREKAYLEFKQEMAKKEQKQLDDLMIMRSRLKDLNAQEETA